MPSNKRGVLVPSTEQTPLLSGQHSPVDKIDDDDEAALLNLESPATVRQSSRPPTSRSYEDDVENGESPPSTSVLRGTLCMCALGCLVLLQATNISMITTIGGKIAEGLEAYEQASWFNSTFLIALGAVGPLNGKLASVFSPRACIFAASLLMAVGVGLCGISNSLGFFLFGRAVSGMGGSGIFVVSVIIILDMTATKHKGLAVGVLNSGYTIGVAAGATAAGALVDVIGWRALFWGQIPLVLLGAIVMFATLPKHRPDASGEPRTSPWKRASHIDFAGALTLSTSLVLLLYALSSPKEIPLWPILLSLIVGVIFVLIEVYVASDPVIPVSLLKSRGMLLTCLSTIFFMMARWSILIYVPTYAIGVRQWSKSMGGAMLIPTNGGFAVGGMLVGWLHIKRHGSFYLPTMVAYITFPCALALLAFVSDRDGSPVAFVIMLFVSGFATGAALNYNLAHLLHLTPKGTHYVASALITTFRSFAGSFGSAIGGGIFTRTLYTSLEEHFAEHGQHREALIRQLLGSPELVQKLKGAPKAAAIQSYEEAVRILWICAAVLAFGTIFVQAGVGWKGHTEKEVEAQERQALLHEADVRNREEVS